MDEDDLQQVDIKLLPHSLQELIACIGLENAYRLTCAFGGRPKYIPKHPARSSLALLLPAQALDALTERYAGIAIEIPKSDHFCRQIRNLKIVQQSSDGLSRSALADKYGLSMRQIGNIRRQEHETHR